MTSRPAWSRRRLRRRAPRTPPASNAGFAPARVTRPGRPVLPANVGAFIGERGGRRVKVGVLMGSASGTDKMRPASDTLARFGIEADVRVLSAHRNPTQVVELVSGARDNGYVAFICGAGMAAHLAGVVAAHTTLPVVGVPLSGGALNGVDALYATVQMPKGIPVATVAVDGSMNAALLVVEMLAITDEGLQKQLADHRREIGGA